MVTIKLDITSDNQDYILQKQMNYSFAFRKLYNNIHAINELKLKLMAKYSLSDYEFNCVSIDVSTKISQVKTQKETLEKEIIEITDEIKELRKKDKLKHKETRKLFKLNKKLDYKNQRLPKDIVFGSKSILRQISYLSNDKEKNSDAIIAKKKEFTENRILPINYVGSANDKNSNRYFNFDFKNNKITYKPVSGVKINISYITSKKYFDILSKLETIKDLKVLPISVKLTTENIFITFDEQILNGFGFDKKGCFAELKTIDKENKEERKQCYIKYKREQNDKQLVNKNINRYCAIDLNPEYIGVSILDKTNEQGDIKIVDKFCYGLTELIEKSNKASSDKETKDKNNKRKYEIGKLYSDLFRIVKHYKCAYFVIEDLNFKDKNINENSKEFNRKTKNVWNLNYQLNLINKHCNTLGIQLIEVNPVYSSFIGNLIYDYFDPVNASIEIGRRGVIKYIKGNVFYPRIVGTIYDTMSRRFESLRDVRNLKDYDTWNKLFTLLTEMKVKYRFQLCDVSHGCFSKDNRKSRVSLYRFS